MIVEGATVDGSVFVDEKSVVYAGATLTGNVRVINSEIGGGVTASGNAVFVNAKVVEGEFRDTHVTDATIAGRNITDGRGVSMQATAAGSGVVMQSGGDMTIDGSRIAGRDIRASGKRPPGRRRWWRP